MRNGYFLMSKKLKKLYIGVFILVIFIFLILGTIKLIWGKENLITTPSPLLNKEGVQANTAKPETETLPLLNQGGARGGNSATPEPENKKNNQSATLVAGGTIVQLNFAPNTTLYNALIEARDAGKLIFAGKNYPGLGFFVTDIGTLHANGRNNLIYSINGKEATVGVSSYTLKDGDIIEWKLE